MAFPGRELHLAKTVSTDPYLFDFLGTADPRHEHEVEASLVAHVERFSTAFRINAMLRGSRHVNQWRLAVQICAVTPARFPSTVGMVVRHQIEVEGGIPTIDEIASQFRDATGLELSVEPFGTNSYALSSAMLRRDVEPAGDAGRCALGPRGPE